MDEIVWTDNARKNLQAIWDYISEEAPGRAEPQIRRIYEAVGRLRGFPRSGRVVPEVDEFDLREVLVDDYRVIYRYSSPNIFILAVIHGRQDFLGFWEPKDETSPSEED